MDGMGGLGTLLGYADVAAAGGGATGYRFISDILKIQPPDGPAAKDIDIPPALDGDGHHGHTPGSDDTPPTIFNLPYATAVRQTLAALRRLRKSYLVVYPDGAGDAFIGHLSKIGQEEIDADRLMTLAAELVVSERPTEIAPPDGESALVTAALAAGVPLEIDLHELPGAVDASGAIVRRILLENTGANPLTISNPAATFGSYEWIAGGEAQSWTVPAGASLMIEAPAALAAVDAAHHLLTLTSALGTAVRLTVNLSSNDNLAYPPSSPEDFVFLDGPALETAVDVADFTFPGYAGGGIAAAASVYVYNEGVLNDEDVINYRCRVQYDDLSWSEYSVFAAAAVETPWLMAPLRLTAPAGRTIIAVAVGHGSELTSGGNIFQVIATGINEA